MAWRGALVLIALLVPGCLSPMEATEALEAPLPPDGTPFLVLARSCFFGVDPLVALVLYPNGTLYHVGFPYASPEAKPNGDAVAPHAESERVALDAEATGALALPKDPQGRYLIGHAEKTQLAPGQLADLRVRVTMAGFGGLRADYTDPGVDDACSETYAAWIDGEHAVIHEYAGSGPWALHRVRDALDELHA